MTESPTLISKHGPVAVMRQADGQHGLFALEPIAADTVICAFAAAGTYDTPTYLTVQTGPHTHITLDPDYLQYCNHSCAPNAFFDTDELRFISLKPIAAGEELRFFYPSSEWKMDQPFRCNCGNTVCLGTIAGAWCIDVQTLSGYRVTGFIRSMLQERAER